MSVSPDLDTPSWAAHRLLFYDRDSELTVVLAELVTDGLQADESVVMIVGADHWAEVEGSLRAERAAVSEARRSGRVIIRDAAETLAAISINGTPDAVAFERVIGPLMQAATAGGRPVRAFGEMVALLWDAGDVSAAIALELLWCQLGDRWSFDLLCAYPATAFSSPEGVGPINTVCGLHSSVRPSGSAGAEPVLLRGYPARAWSVSQARQDLAVALRLSGNSNAVDAALLVATELATNAVRHARTDFVVEATRRERLLRIAVRDRDSRSPQPATVGPDAESGRGLPLIAALSRQWGITPTVHGKVTWAELSDG